MDRRCFLTGTVASAAALAARPVSAALPVRSEVSLKTLAAPRGIDVSTAYNGGGSADLEALIVHHCDIVTPENALKPGFLAPKRTSTLAFGRMDATATFCRVHGLRLHGHTLHWHQTQPAWLNAAGSGTFVRDYTAYVGQVMSRYADLVDSWDVINEPFSDRMAGYRRNPVLDAFGDDFLIFLFRTARRAAPRAKLLLNDYSLSCGETYCQRKRDTALGTIERLMKVGVPIDGVGLQAHLLPTQPVRQKPLSAFLRSLNDLGLEVFITEMDVNDIQLPEHIATRDKMIAQIYRDYLGIVLEHKNVKRLGFWGLSDAAHWIVHGYAPFRRKIGPPRPALFDEHYQPKPAFFAVAEALKQAPARV